MDHIYSNGAGTCLIQLTYIELKYLQSLVRDDADFFLFLLLLPAWLVSLLSALYLYRWYSQHKIWDLISSCIWDRSSKNAVCKVKKKTKNWSKFNSLPHVVKIKSRESFVGYKDQYFKEIVNILSSSSIISFGDFNHDIFNMLVH